MLNENLTKELALSEAVNIDDIQKDKMNIISAPVSSGKTYAAIHKFSSLLADGQKMLYLIDTTAGKENISYSYSLIREFGDKEIQAYDKEVVAEYVKKRA